MTSVTFNDAPDLWSALVEIGRNRQSGLIAARAPQGLLCRIREGRIVAVEGELPGDVWGDGLAAVSALADSTVERVTAMAKIARVTPDRLFTELGLADEATVEQWTIAAIFRALVLAEGPWEWRELAIDDEGEGVSVFDALARALASADSAQVGRWGAPLNDLVFVADASEIEDIDRGAAAWLVSRAEPQPLKALLQQPLETPRLTLAWLAIARNAGWLRVADVASEAHDTGASPSAGITADTIDLSSMSEAGSSDEQDSEDFVELDDNLEIADVEFELDAEDTDATSVSTEGQNAGTGGGPVSVVEAEPLVEAEVVVEQAAPVEEESPAEPMPVAEAEPAPQPPPEPVRKRFYEIPVPADIHKRLGVPPGAAGQGVLQAYSKRYRRIQKLLSERPADPGLEAWRRGLLHAYRILSNAEALQWYERLVARGDLPDPAGYVAAEMANRAYERGLALLRGGDLVEAGKALHEALSWDDTHARAWLALGLQQAAHEDDPDEVADAFRSFSRAVACAPDDPHAHYYRAVAAHFAGEQAAWNEERAWLEQHADRAPEAWARFREQAA